MAYERRAALRGGVKNQKVRSSFFEKKEPKKLSLRFACA